MKKLLVLTSFLLGAAASYGQSPKVKSATVSFHTTSDDKDGDTQIRDQLTCNGHDLSLVANLKLECCSSGKNSKDDHFDNNSDRTRAMTVVFPTYQKDLRTCIFRAGSRANGNDNWVAKYTLDFVLDDPKSTHIRYSLGEIALNSRGSIAAYKSVTLASITPTSP